MKLNNDLSKIKEENEFFMLTEKVKNFRKNNPNCEIISLGIGDVSKPIIKPIINAMHEAVEDLSKMETFKGYGDSSGYHFLKQKILENDYKNMDFTFDEIYISNGTKTDVCSILELFDINSTIYIPSLIYPIYKNGVHCLSRNLKYFHVHEKENFVPQVPNEKFDIVYICSPNNPTGIAYSYEDLRKWVNYAIENNAIILYDNAYSAFINSPDVPKSIYKIDGANKVAIEFRSFSKNISFSGVRCSYYVIPNKIYDGINKIWKKRTINRFNGADYIAQKGAEASYIEDAQTEIKKNIDDYLNNTKRLKSAFKKLGFTVFGGEDSPFLWVKIKEGINSWEIFNLYLKELNIIIIPGIIFGEKGDGFFRVSGLGSRENIEKAIEKLEKYYNYR